VQIIHNDVYIMHLDFHFMLTFKIFLKIYMFIFQKAPGKVFKHPANYVKADLIFFFFPSIFIHNLITYLYLFLKH